jgi:hypothetical protein
MDNYKKGVLAESLRKALEDSKKSAKENFPRDPDSQSHYRVGYLESAIKSVIKELDKK